MGMIYVFTGDGKGKTSAALGVALRSYGYRKTIVFVQFMKNRETGEIKFADKRKGFAIHQFGSENFVDLSHPSEDDRKRAEAGLEFAEAVITKKAPDLLVLDEINVAVRHGLLKGHRVLDLIRKLPENTDIILTGRDASKEIIEVADLVTEMKEIKHPYAKGTEAKKGLDF
ncbi:MAG: cob(I)yrinic acid a,c-diamide adenosyltransferase [Candidatus Aenigmarchaeota archaeon]|nr:cob(I)yrinic acid a,c-diamide adenosyltransferase [Candidatus Aenigmarchaeota archaeon]